MKRISLWEAMQLPEKKYQFKVCPSGRTLDGYVWWIRPSRDSEEFGTMGIAKKVEQLEQEPDNAPDLNIPEMY